MSLKQLQPKSMKPAEFIALSACTMTLTALGIDIMLPVFGELRKHFGLRPESTAPAQIIVFFFMGQIAQILFGALSDRFGQLAILRVGFPLYIVGGIAATFAPNLEFMFAARFVAGMASAVYGTSFFFIGASLGSVVSHLMVNGVFPLVLSFFVIGLTTVLLVFSDRRPLSRQSS